MKLKEYRILNKLTQEEVANQLNVSRGTYVYYESENISIPMDKFIILCKLYKCSPNNLVGYDDFLSKEDLEVIDKAIKILTNK